MPSALKHRCGKRGCPKRTAGRFCDEHLPEARRRYDAHRESGWQRGYDDAWKQVAAARRELDCGLCQECLKVHRLTPSRLVDHIVPIHVRPNWRLEIGNTQVLCSVCHGRKSGEDLKRYGGRGRIELTSLQRRNRYAAQRLEMPARVRDEDLAEKCENVDRESGSDDDVPHWACE